MVKVVRCETGAMLKVCSRVPVQVKKRGRDGNKVFLYLFVCLQETMEEQIEKLGEARINGGECRTLPTCVVYYLPALPCRAGQARINGDE